MNRAFVVCIVSLLLVSVLPAAQAERIRDLVTVQGVRSNALMGYVPYQWHKHCFKTNGMDC